MCARNQMEWKKRNWVQNCCTQEKNTRKNGVGVTVNRQFAHKLVKVNRYCDRIITVQVIISKKVWNIISVYAPQVGRPQNEKETFLEELKTILDNIPRSKKILIGGDLERAMKKVTGSLN